MAKIDDIKVKLDLGDSMLLVAKYLEENIPAEFGIKISSLVAYLREEANGNVK
jgi:hypothetical protein